MKVTAESHIILKGIQQNNLKNFNLNLPKNKLIVVTGVSGSGKSSLVFDTLRKESQRHFFSQLSSGASRLGSKMEKAGLDEASGLTPCISVSQIKGNFSPRSTLGTLTGLYDLLRLLFARIGDTPDTELQISRSLFSFNTKAGACKHCQGLGVEDVISVDLLLEDENRSIRDKAFKVTQPNGYTMYSQVTIDAMDQVCKAHGFSVDIPWKNLSEAQKNVVLRGSDRIKIPFGKHTLESRMKWSGITAKPREEGCYKGILPVMEEILKRDRNPNILKYAKTRPCSHCNGKRLSQEALSVFVNGKDIAGLSSFSLEELQKWLSELNYADEHKQHVIESVQKSMMPIINQLKAFGLGYLSLSRLAAKLNSGELQRIRLVRQLDNTLRNLTFIFDEPSIGVHPAQNAAIIQAMHKLVEQGNTVIVVEHDGQMIRSADWIVEIGPHAGENGGELLFNGKREDFLKSSHPSLSRDFISGKSKLVFPDPALSTGSFYLRNAEINNLKNIDVEFRYKQLNVLCGIAGAGKNSLLYQTLLPLFKGNYQQQLNAKGNPVLKNANFKNVFEVDQSPIGRSARSTPATYTKIHDGIRDLFASLPDAKDRGFTKSTFSYNSKTGCCTECEGAGKIEIGMHFLGNVEQMCPKCKGKRYRDEVLEVKYEGSSISDVLSMAVSEAVLFLSENKKLKSQLQTLNDIGLGYLRLGQSSNSLSGGEAQRIKLAAQLMKSTSGNNLFVLNEPSTGLHHSDLKILLKLFEKILEKGNTLILIEHNEEIISLAQHIIEIGPEAGKEGGEVVFSGSSKDFLKANTLSSRSVLHANEALPSTVNTKERKAIHLKGIETHNLDIPSLIVEDGKHTVITGPSGSGKSSLAFDTLYVEARNRYLESFPAYLRQNLISRSSAVYDALSGLTPCIGLRQRNDVSDPRSTLGTLSELYDYFRLIYARIATENSRAKGLDLQNSSSYSFNNSEVACPHCKGLGKELDSNLTLLCSDLEKSVFEGAFRKHKSLDFYADPYGQYLHTLVAAEGRLGLDFRKAVKLLNEREQQVFLYGSGDELYDVEWKFKRKNREGIHTFKGKWEGFVPLLLDEYYRKNANGKGMELLSLFEEVECKVCEGERFIQEVKDVRFHGYNISELMSLSVDEIIVFLQEKKEAFKNHTQLFDEVVDRLRALHKLDLGYLSPNRQSKTLSGGELQKLLLAKVLNSKMSGVTYILDEPTSGLHIADTHKVLDAINRIVEQGNTVLSVEHNLEFLQKADKLIHIGPGSGVQGGKLVEKDPEEDLTVYMDSFGKRKQQAKPSFFVKGAKANNLKDLSVEFKTGSINALCGVSGSGKTTLMRDVLLKSYHAGTEVCCEQITGLESFAEVHWVDRKGAAASSYSTVVSYLGIFDSIRKIFAVQAKLEGKRWKATHFSFSNKLSQCPECKGNGFIHTKLDFINDVISTCDQCKGRRFIPELLACKVDGCSIADVLEMSLEQAASFFSDKKIVAAFKLMQELGLGYLKLGQRTSQLSGGEAQRLKITKAIYGKSDQAQLYIFDEPGKGLYISDLHYLNLSFEKLLDAGHTIIIIEHNPLLLLTADWLVELGEGSGVQGGNLLFSGDIKGFFKASTRTSKCLLTL